MTAKTMFGDVQLDAKLASILGPYGDMGSQCEHTTWLISSLSRLRTSRAASVTISAALGIALITSTAILFDRVSKNLNELQEAASSPDQTVAQLAPPLGNSHSAVSAIQSSSVGLELRDTRTVEVESLKKPARSLQKARLSRSFTQPDFGITREIEAPRMMRDVLLASKSVPNETAPADGAIASTSSNVVLRLDLPSSVQNTDKHPSGNIVVETDRSEISPRVRRDTLDAIRALRRQW